MLLIKLFLILVPTQWRCSRGRQATWPWSPRTRWTRRYSSQISSGIPTIWPWLRTELGFWRGFLTARYNSQNILNVLTQWVRLLICEMSTKFPLTFSRQFIITKFEFFLNPDRIVWWFSNGKIYFHESESSHLSINKNKIKIGIDMCELPYHRQTQHTLWFNTPILTPGANKSLISDIARQVRHQARLGVDPPVRRRGRPLGRRVAGVHDPVQHRPAEPPARDRGHRGRHWYPLEGVSRSRWVTLVSSFFYCK